MGRYPLLLFFFTLSALLVSGCRQKPPQERYRPVGEAVTENGLYIFGIHPYKNSQAMHEAYEPILRYLEGRVSGVRFRLETSNNYGHFESKLYSGHFDLALPNPYQTVRSFEKGYRVIAKMAPDSQFKGIIVARKDAGITSVDQLRGKPVSFPAPTALAATMMPLYYLQTHGLDVTREIIPKYVGSQHSAILNAYTGATAAGGTWPPPWQVWRRENPEKAEEMEVIWQTDPLPNNGVVIRRGLPKETGVRIANALAAMSRTPEGAALLKTAGFDGFETASDQTFAPVVEFLREYDRRIGLPEATP